jgi:DNA mismatch repair protein MutL
MTIHLLPPDVAAKIAAGEVVERPVNVAKELIENSLDAGATEIRLELREGGQRLLRVSDNGHGMRSDEAALAFLRHATSKLDTVDDLSRINTFGFRGEALFSIAAVSQVTLTTRHREDEFGAQIRIEGGAIVSQARTGAPVGAIVTVEHLFYNVPARQKFLRKPTTEMGQIADLMQRFALAHPERRFSLVVDGRFVFQSTGSGDLFAVLTKIYGLEQAKQMAPIGVASAEWRDPKTLRSREAKAPSGFDHPLGTDKAENNADNNEPLHGEIDFMAHSFMAHSDPNEHSPTAHTHHPLSVSGYASLPTLTRPNRGEIQLFVNRRPVEDRNLTWAVVQSYHTLLPVGRYPLAVILIEIDPALVDVNVHPQKSQVRFAEDRAVFAAVQKAVRQAVMRHAPPPELVFPAPHPEPWPPSSTAGAPSAGWAVATSPDSSQARLDMPIPEPPSPLPQSGALAPTPAENDMRPPLLARRSSQLPPLRVVGQIGATYIITEGPEGMYLIDQHAAHERILYEKLMSQQAEQNVARQQLLQPLTLHVGSLTAGLVAQYMRELEEVGFAIEPFGADTFLVRTVPAILSGQEPLRALEEMVTSLAERRNLAGEAAEARLVKLVCKRASIKAGQLLSDLEMQELVRQLEECQSPRTCPHGRPTMIQLAASELEKAFGRV